MKILNVTSLIRNNLIDGKQNENTVLFDIDKEFGGSKYNISFCYLYLHPYANRLLGKKSLKWKQYSSLTKRSHFTTLGFLIYTLPVFIIPVRSSLNRILFWATTLIFRKRIDRLIKVLQPAVIQAHDVNQSAFVARYISRKYGIPYVIVPRGIRQKQLNYITKNILDSSVIICHGYYHLKPISDRFGHLKTVLIPHGVERDLFIPHSERHVSQNRIKVVSIGKLLKGKNFLMLIRAVSKFDDFELDIYGDGPERNNITQLILELKISDKVRLITEPFANKDLSVIFSSYNLFALISFPETFGRVFAEAIVSGLPIIGAREAGLYGQLEEGTNAFFVDSERAEDLERLLHYITENRQILEKMSENNLILRTKYSWDTILNQYYQLYKSLNKSTDGV